MQLQWRSSSLLGTLFVLKHCIDWLALCGLEFISLRFSIFIVNNALQFVECGHLNKACGSPNIAPRCDLAYSKTMGITHKSKSVLWVRLCAGLVKFYTHTHIVIYKEYYGYRVPLPFIFNIRPLWLIVSSYPKKSCRVVDMCIKGSKISCQSLQPVQNYTRQKVWKLCSVNSIASKWQIWWQPDY